MNLRGIANRATSGINPNTPVVIRKATGYTTDASGERIATYTTIDTTAQIQSLTADELQQVNMLNMQGVKRAAYLNGDWRGVVRTDGAGGDLMTFGGDTWKIILAIETWPDWSKVALCLQASA